MWLTKDRGASVRLDDLLACTGLPLKSMGGEAEGMDLVTAADGTHLGVASVHPVERLPQAYVGLPNGHKGSHQFLVDDFVRACVMGRTPSNNVWDAARYAIPGIVAHQSAVQGGALLEIPDLGDAPADWRPACR